MNVVKEHTEQIETNQEPSEKEDTETVDTTEAANAGDKAIDGNQKEVEDGQLTKPQAENRRQTRTQAKVEKEKPIENRRLTRRLTRAKAKMAVEPQPQPQVEEKKR